MFHYTRNWRKYTGRQQEHFFYTEPDVVFAPKFITKVKNENEYAHKLLKLTVLSFSIKMYYAYHELILGKS